MKIMTKFTVFILLSVLILSACQTSNNDNLILDEGGSKRKLVIELVSFKSRTNKKIHDKIRSFNERRSDIEIEIRTTFKTHELGFTPWLLDNKKGAGDPPDLIELAPNQMKLAFHHGKLEPLNLEPSHLGELLITSSDGNVLGVKSRINPLIVYYNEEDFEVLGLEEPAADWDWSMLDNTIASLKTAGKNVYIRISPSILEWLTINRYGGRIVDASGTIFTGYLDSEEAIQAAEWLKWVGTKREDYKLRKRTPNDTYDPMPLDLVEGNMALAIDWAYIFRAGSVLSTFEDYIHRYDKINIAPLPGGPDSVNVALTMGLAMPAYSENKDLAMELLRYLTKDPEVYYEDVMLYSIQADAKLALNDPERISILYQETRRSVPTSLYMFEGQNNGNNRSDFSKSRRNIMNGQPIQEILERAAEEIELNYQMFKEDLENYSNCIKDYSSFCNGWY